MAHILVIQENPADTKLALLLLGNAGHAVSCAADAEAGLTLARRLPPDVILMDMQMRGVDGRAASALLKQDPHTGSIPMIAAAAHVQTTTGDREPHFGAGCDAYVVKPFRYSALSQVLDDLLGAGDDESPQPMAH